MPSFSHLHCHTQFSMLDGAASIEQIIKKAKKEEMPAAAITDHGNMFGVPEFVNTAQKHDVKPIIGCEFYITPTSMDDRSNRTRYHQVLLAKNMKGYKNLAKLSSLGYVDGMYYKPRIDKKTLANYSEGLIATTCCLASEINQTIINKGEEPARAIFEWYLNLFGDDYYIELQRHGLQDQNRCNEILVRWAKEYNVKMIATNDSHYVEREDSEAHDILLALQTNADLDDPKRFRFTDDNNNLNPEFYLKSPEEMNELFDDLPESVDTTNEIVDKVEAFDITSELMLPHYTIPEQFDSMDDYLRHMAFEGARTRYGELSHRVTQRIEQELNIIQDMGFAGYFLVVQDFTTEARRRNVFVGPGRGSAAGSVVAYCLGIINIDPLKYDLLFERFLNPERVNPPDIDIDFDDTGRQEVIDYVVDEYGRDNVAQIVTYGTMKAKTAIRDVGRVLGVPLEEVNRISKLFPERPGIDTFDKVLNPDLNPDTHQQIQNIFDHDDERISKMMKFARTLEGSARQTGIHAAGVIIAPGEISDYVPVALSKEKDVITQYDGPSAEDCGLLKMDFLGLKTLSILKTAIEFVDRNYGKHYDLDDIPQDDETTYELYQKGNTVGTFQFESDGMRKHLKNLKPTDINDLIAMNALYRPGPMQFIPEYIDRKHGRKEVDYPHESIKDILKPTYGIMIYQEQIMQIAQRMGDYSLGEADLLRRAMGKKKKKIMAEQQKIFIERAIDKGIEKATAQEVFDRMAKFAEYGFNKSHSAAYSVVAYQTAYFKANYPAEYMASVLSHNMGDIDKVSKFIEECQRMGITVDAPNINTGEGKFVAKKGRIQYGLDAIKGVGSNAVAQLVKERDKNGEFTSIFDFSSRIDSRTCNRRTYESLIKAGAFDTIYKNRSQLFASLDTVIGYGARKQEEERLNQANLFGAENGNDAGLSEPSLADVPPWSNIERLNYERELIGFYLSGHPLSKFREDLNLFCSHDLAASSIRKMDDRQQITVGAIITEVQRRTNRKGLPFAFIQVEDLKGTIEVMAFTKVYDRYLGLIQVDNVVQIKGSLTRRDGTPKIIADSFKRLETLREDNQTRLELLIDLHTKDLSTEKLKSIASLFEQNQGQTQVRLKVHSPKANGPIKMNMRKYVIEPNDEVLNQLRNKLGGENITMTLAN